MENCINTNEEPIPESLYKFACFDEEEHYKELIQDNILYFASPENFNDPFDCAIAPDFAAYSDEQFVEIVKQSKIKDKQKYDIFTDIINRKKDALKIIRENQIRITNAIREMRKDIGICCLCGERNNLLMWSHYAKGHKGFCLEFDGPQIQAQFLIYRTLLKPVIYSSDYPSFEFPPDMFKWAILATTTKSDLWKYEKEWRLIRPKGPNKKYKYRDSNLISIYLGIGCQDEEVNKIKELIKNKSPKPTIYKGRMADFKFEIVFDPIPNG